MAFYLFPGTMYRRLKAVYESNPDNRFKTTTNVITQELQDAYTLYQFCTKQYLGLGFLLQFIPGTNQHRAREQLATQLNTQINYALGSLLQRPSSIELRAATNSLSSYLNFEPYFTLLIHIKQEFRLSDLSRNTDNIFSSLHFNLFLNLTLLKNKLKLSAIQPNFFSSVFSFLANPTRPVYFVVNQAHALANYVVDVFLDISKAIGADYLVLGFTLLGMKAINSLVFGILKSAIKFVELSIDLLFNLVYILTINPLVHVLKSLGNALDHRGNGIIMATAGEFSNEVALRQAAEETTKKTNQETSTHLLRKYIGLAAGEQNLHSQNINKLIAVSEPQKKIPSTVALLSIVSIFNKKNTANTTIDNDLDSIQNAQNILRNCDQ